MIERPPKQACGCKPPGSATSAASMARAVGVRQRYDWLWVPAEGWVRWDEIQRQVDQAFRAWRARRAFNGTFMGGGMERGIQVALARRAGAALKRAA
jgi:hypothetical protein